MKKKIIISEEKLREVISDIVDNWSNNNNMSFDEVVTYQLFKKGIINEMAFNKKDFIRHIASLRIQLIENWCLCAYFCLYWMSLSD